MDGSVKTRILDAAFKVVDEHTISGTRMHLIAQKCDMVQSNLLYHFKSKRELLIALINYMQSFFSEDREEILANAPDTLRGQLAGFFEQKRRLVTQQPAYDRVQMDFWSFGQVEPEVNETFDNSYKTWRGHIAEVILRYDPSLDPEKVKLAAHIMVSMMCGASLQYLCNSETFNLDAYYESCVDMVEKFLEP